MNFSFTLNGLLIVLFPTIISLFEKFSTASGIDNCTSCAMNPNKSLPSSLSTNPLIQLNLTGFKFNILNCN